MLTEPLKIGDPIDRPPLWSTISPTPLIVYLDQWCWDRLARDRAGCATCQGDEGTYDYLKRLTRSGTIVIPLSQATYREQWARTNDDARWDCAVVMAELTGFTTFSPVNLSRWEAEVGMVEWLGMDLDVPQPGVLGVGLRHALSGIEALACVVDERGRRIDGSTLPPRLQDQLESLHEEAAYEVELFNLALGDPRFGFAQRVTEADLGGQRAEDFVDQQITVRDAIDRHGRTLEVVRNTIIMMAFQAAEAYLSEAASRLGVDWPAQLAAVGELPPTDRIKDLHRLVHAMPIQGTFAELKLQAHRKDNFGWSTSDIMDFFAAAQLAPFADVLVADRKTFNLLADAGVAARHDVNIVRRLEDLLSAIEQRLSVRTAGVDRPGR